MDICDWRVGWGGGGGGGGGEGVVGVSMVGNDLCCNDLSMIHVSPWPQAAAAFDPLIPPPARINTNPPVSSPRKPRLQESQLKNSTSPNVFYQDVSLQALCIRSLWVV